MRKCGNTELVCGSTGLFGGNTRLSCAHKQQTKLTRQREPVLHCIIPSTNHRIPGFFAEIQDYFPIRLRNICRQSLPDSASQLCIESHMLNLQNSRAFYCRHTELFFGNSGLFFYFGEICLSLPDRASQLCIASYTLNIALSIALLLLPAISDILRSLMFHV